MVLAKNETEKWTYSDYLGLEDERRIELFEGGIRNMGPAPSRAHQKVSGEFFRQAANFLLHERCAVYAAPFDVRLPLENETDEQATTVVQPDISIVCDEAKLDERGCKGTPDFIAEIVSPSSASVDYIEKAKLYEKHGVREYWILHPVEKILITYRLNEKGKFGPPEFVKGEGRLNLAVLKDLSIDLDLVFAS